VSILLFCPGHHKTRVIRLKILYVLSDVLLNVHLLKEERKGPFLAHFIEYFSYHFSLCCSRGDGDVPAGAAGDHRTPALPPRAVPLHATTRVSDRRRSTQPGMLNFVW
jgi:hypothetical protein